MHDYMVITQCCKMGSAGISATKLFSCKKCEPFCILHPAPLCAGISWQTKRKISVLFNPNQYWQSVFIMQGCAFIWRINAPDLQHAKFSSGACKNDPHLWHCQFFFFLNNPFLATYSLTIAYFFSMARVLICFKWRNSRTFHGVNNKHIFNLSRCHIYGYLSYLNRFLAIVLKFFNIILV